ncbi:PaiB family negative transcriptional regulator [Pacificibacter maritimus]|uniref:PaiB family negative transcriptional regulator n=1 Tax=Pacificibacter maritimus TaxID=762213 RepID=A0A3N4VB26_9RHOB|nr:FMN-binding negative transcriptional regulator [Pacificibacter maritimus]RPE71020.1 PaiB family negative transcriptional regulator [Pacificibacter maritimus]
MYRPKNSAIDDQNVLSAAVDQIGFGALVTFHEGAFETSYLPVVIKQTQTEFIIEAHCARANTHWKIADKGTSMFMFQGPHAYVSAGHYATKSETGKVVPTWNYIVVHAHGTLQAMKDPNWLVAHLDELTAKNEEGRAEPWQVSDAPVAYIAALKRGIVGLRFRVNKFEGRWKLEQATPAKDRASLVQGLSNEGDMARDLAEALHYFPQAED